MIELNPQYEMIFSIRNLDDDCNRIAGLMNEEAAMIKAVINAGVYKQAVIMYLQLLKSMCLHFVDDEHYCYFDDLYSPEYILQGIFEKLQMQELGFETAMLLKEGHDEIMQTECYYDFGYPTYL